MNSSYRSKLRSTSNKKIKIHDSRSATAQGDLRMIPELSEKELGLIFGNHWLSTADLLNFRRVNKSWRDAATSALVQRDSCCVTLTRYDSRNGYGGTDKSNFSDLSQLADLISKSQMFPTTNFCIRTTSIDYSSDDPDLHLFLICHGDKIKTLGLKGYISRKLLLNYFFIYTPSLECLNLSDTENKTSKKWGSKNMIDLLWSSKPLSLKSLSLGSSWEDKLYPDSNLEGNLFDSENNGEDSNSDIEEDDSGSDSDVEDDADEPDRKMIQFLLSSPSKLSYIKNVDLDTLGGILREGKGHLIQEFTVRFSKSFSPSESHILETFLSLKPQLSTAVLEFTNNKDLEAGSRLEHSNVEVTSDVTLVNGLIDSFKDTVQNLTFRISNNNQAWNKKVKIPPLKHVKVITVTISNGYESKCDSLDWSCVEFESEISADNYFPNLTKVSLKFGGGRSELANPLNFFSRFKSEKDGSVWDSLPSVQVLCTESPTIKHLSDAFPEKTPSFSAMFPNIRILKIHCTDLGELASCCWGLCPKVEFLEIYGIQTFSCRGSDAEMSLLIDMFFTGFSLDTCKKLRAEELPQEMDNEAALTFLRVKPSICDLQNLRELKLAFCSYYGWSPTGFASRVTGAYALSKIPNVKIILSHPSKIIMPRKPARKSTAGRRQLPTRNVVGETEQCFAPIKPYVQIVFY